MQPTTCFSGNIVGRVSARVLEGPSHPDLGQHDEPGWADLGKGPEVLDSRPVHSTAAGDENAQRVPGHSFDPAVQQQHPQDQLWVTNQGSRGEGSFAVENIVLWAETTLPNARVDLRVEGVTWWSPPLDIFSSLSTSHATIQPPRVKHSISIRPSSINFVQIRPCLGVNCKWEVKSSDNAYN